MAQRLWSWSGINLDGLIWSPSHAIGPGNLGPGRSSLNEFFLGFVLGKLGLTPTRCSLKLATRNTCSSKISGEHDLIRHQLNKLLDKCKSLICHLNIRFNEDGFLIQSLRAPMETLLLGSLWLLARIGDPDCAISHGQCHFKWIRLGTFEGFVSFLVFSKYIWVKGLTKIFVTLSLKCDMLVVCWNITLPLPVELFTPRYGNLFKWTTK